MRLRRPQDPARIRRSTLVEENPVGQGLIAALMVVVVLFVALWNMPAGRARVSVSSWVNPVVQAVGLDQNWALFAPTPRNYGIAVYATVTYADGRTKKVTIPHNGILISPYYTYRWQKYVENLHSDSNSSLWPPAARWFARQAGGHPVKVSLTREFRTVSTPGDKTSRPPREYYTFYTLKLP